MSSALDWISSELQKWEEESLLRRRREVQPLTGGQCLVDGKIVWDFASNNYLGLAEDPRVVAAAAEVLKTHGVGSKASALVSGRTDLHVRLERTLAEFEGTEAAILFPTGMAANVGTLSSLMSKEDSVFSDRMNHASLIDGCRLSGAELRIYRHDELDGLRNALRKDSGRRKFIVTDSVFSMDGDLAPLPELCEISEQFGAALIVDEAHGTGVFGEHGRGVAEHQHVEKRVAVKVGTLSKAVGAIGGFVTGSETLINFLWNKARTQVYSTALPPAICAAAIAAINLIRTEPERRESLRRTAQVLRDQLAQAGISTYPGSIGPIIPIVLHDPEAAMQIAKSLFADGYLVGAIRPPTVPRGTSRLRITVRAGMPLDVVDGLAQSLAAAITQIDSRTMRE